MSPDPAGRNDRPLARTGAALLAAGTLLAAPGVEAATPDAIELLLAVGPGTGAERVEEVAGERADRATVHPWNEPGGLSRGLLDEPGLLALLNRYDVDHPLLRELPDEGPIFHRIALEEARLSVAVLDGRVWGVAAAVPLRPDRSVAGPRANPFTRARLKPQRDALRALRRACRTFRTVRTDAYGNGLRYRGERCGGATVHVRLDWRHAPAGATQLRVLTHRPTTAR